MEQRKAWSDNHKVLTEILLKPQEHPHALDIFLKQHAWLYASQMANHDGPTYEDDLLINIQEQTLRSYPVQLSGTKNSIVWHIWHSARIEDITMNILIANHEQILHSDSYKERMGIRFIHSGNGMSEDEIAELSSAIHIEALLAYRLAVGRRTRDIISSLMPEQFKAKIQPEQIKRLSEEEAVMESENWLIEYWGNKKIAGLVLMPATRHNFIHLNKSMRIKLKLQKQNS